MTERFPVGSKAYTKEGRAYTVEEVDGGIVYCSLPNGTETDFPEGSLISEAEWASRSDGQDEVIYGRVKRSNAFSVMAAGLNAGAAEKLLSRAENLSPGLLDFAAFTVANRSLEETGHGDQVDSLSIIKCRAAFDDQKPEARLSALASVLGAEAKVLASVADHGENLIKAMIDKGMAPLAQSFDDFCDRPRK